MAAFAPRVAIVTTNNVSDDEVFQELLDEVEGDELFIQCAVLNRMIQNGKPDSYKSDI